MQAKPTIQEQQRLASLECYDILDTPPEEAFDRLTRLVRRIFDVPMSTLTLVDGRRQWFKSRQGVSACATSREPSFCDVALRSAQPLLVPDARADDRFADNPFVVGAPHIRFYAGVPLTTPEGHGIGTLCAMDTRPRDLSIGQMEVLADLAGIAMNELELRRLAITDGLTGAYSRRAFRSELDRTLSLSQRQGNAVSCIMLDLDHFKAVNDRYGHAVGDRVLSETGTACREALRRSDSFGRMGGEEFAILLPDTGSASAMAVAEKVRSAIERLRIPTPSGPIGVTASFGVAALDGSATSAEMLLQRADAALYDAKKAGRNRCVASRPAVNAKRGLRGPAHQAARISFDSGRAEIECTVRTLSDASAGLKIASMAAVPDTFSLLIDSDHSSRRCHVVGKTGRYLDVAFV